jgi:hypothetical protein
MLPTTIIVSGPSRRITLPSMSVTVLGERSTRRATLARPSLVSPSLDVWLVGGVALVVWAVARLTSGWSGWGSSTLVWTITLLGGAHYVSTYGLAAGAGAAGRRAHPWALVRLPVLAVVVTLAAAIALWNFGATAPLAWLVTLVFTFTVWHGIKQTYGVCRLLAAVRGVTVSPRQAQLLRYGFYPLWCSAVIALLDGGLRSSLGGLPVGWRVLPAGVSTVGTAASVVAAGAVVSALVWIRVSNGHLPLAIPVAAVAWLLWLAAPPPAAIAMLAAFHALQYLACAHPVTWSRLAPHEQVDPWWPLRVFGPAGAVGLFVAAILPPMLDQWLTVDGVAVATVVAFVVLNLQHYSMDMVIWRMSAPSMRAAIAARSHG